MPHNDHQTTPNPEVAALAAVATLESVVLGQPWADAHRQAVEAVRLLRRGAEDRIFPSEVTPTSADVIAAYNHHAARWPRSACGRSLASLHARTLGTWPALAAFCRTSEAIGDVGHAAAARASALNRPGSELADEAIDSYMFDIARQLIGAGHELAAAAHEFIRSTELGERLAAARTRHEAHARASIAEDKKRAEQVQAQLAAEDRRHVAEAREREAAAAAAASEAKRAARLTRAAALAARLRTHATTHKTIDVGSEKHNCLRLAVVVKGMSHEQLSRIEAALEGRLVS